MQHQLTSTMGCLQIFLQLSSCTLCWPPQGSKISEFFDAQVAFGRPSRVSSIRSLGPNKHEKQQIYTANPHPVSDWASDHEFGNLQFHDGNWAISWVNMIDEAGNCKSRSGIRSSDSLGETSEMSENCGRMPSSQQKNEATKTQASLRLEAIALPDM